KGYFRIATTKGEIWRNDEQTSKNNIYVLNDILQMSGKIEDIAPGERIYSVRFMGERGYMVTFQQVDPLFVIDLKDPQHPQILGALKIPGFSDYLHPYDENHIIGFGKDAVVLPQKDGSGNTVGTTAFYEGMKIAIFDVSDVAHPVEMFKEIIGDRGTYSELLNNPKALLFSKEKNLMALPVNLMEIKQAPTNTDFPAYGEFTFQGAYVYNVDLVHGFTLKGRITHMDTSDQIKAGDNWYDGNKNVDRILYIGDTLYTLSNSMIKANDISTLKEINSLPIPQ
ncbi:MAG: beta-propeller domain-containing protein, partial [Bacillota bacterium]